MKDVAKDDWDSHWNDYGRSNGANPAQAYRRRVITHLLDLGVAQQARFLDVGAGTGEYIADVHGANPDVPKLGLEYSAKGVEIARAKVAGAKFQQIDLLEPVTTLPEYHNWATHAVCSEVLEHVDDPVLLIKNAATFMAPGCRLIVTVPGGPMSAFDKHIGHRQHFTVRSIHDVLKTAGLNVDLAVGAGFPFFNLYRMLVLARGKTLIDDAEGAPGLLMKSVSTVFNGLMPLNLTRSTFGWQIIAVARKPL
jgi:SAM-dependent methyltransferase